MDVSTITTVLLTIFTGIYVYLTHQLVKDNRRIMEESRRPEVGIRLLYSVKKKEKPALIAPSNGRLTILLFNVGTGPAYDVRLSAHEPQPGAFHIPIDKVPAFRNGVPVLAHGAEIPLYSIHFAVREAETLRPVDSLMIVAEYKDALGKQHERHLQLDSIVVEDRSEDQDIAFLERQTLKNISSHLSDMRASLSGISKSLHSLSNQQDRG